MSQFKDRLRDWVLAKATGHLRQLKATLTQLLHEPVRSQHEAFLLQHLGCTSCSGTVWTRDSR
jgi:hypothetical protein